MDQVRDPRRSRIFSPWSWRPGSRPPVDPGYSPPWARPPVDPGYNPPGIGGPGSRPQPRGIWGGLGFRRILHPIAPGGGGY